MRKLVLLLGLCGLALTSTVQAAQKQASIVIKNATVVTMDAGRRVFDKGTVVITGRSITAVGDSALADEYKAPSVIDAHGDIVMPGMINTHNHIGMLAFRGLGENNVQDRLFKFFFPLEKQLLDRRTIRVASRQAAIELATTGVTTTADMYYHEDEVARAVKEVGIRGVLGETIIGFPVVDAPEPYGGLEYAERFIKEFKGDELITPVLAPHAPYSVSPDMLMKTKALAEHYGVPMLMHLAESATEWDRVRQKFPEVPRQGTEIEYLDKLGFLGPDLVGAHVIYVNESDIDILKRRGVGIAHNPKANSKGFAKEQAGQSPALAMYRDGLAIGLGTDGPLSSNQMDIISVMGYAQRISNFNPLNFQKSGFVPAELVEMATIGGARALKMDDRIGSLETGKFADLIIVDTQAPNMLPMYDVYAALVYQANPGNVRTTIVNGRVVFQDGQIKTLDLTRHRREWAEVTARVAEFAKTLH